MATKTTTKRTVTKKAPASKSSPAKKAAKTPAKKNAAKELKDLFEDSLKDIYWAEKALVKALPKMQKNATDKRLKTAIENHLMETQIHVKRLEECFKSLKKKATAKKCDAMQGLLDEGKSIMEETAPGSVRDAGIIAAAQKVEHYEIATYGTLAAYAKVLKENFCLKNFLATLNEEKKCDALLTKVADTRLNTKAL
ncbi:MULTISPECIES: ferritin-like domain-containing protein [Chryseobacterium]|uniref:Ferritin-like metal-binding protein YciE n=1 Tax=Chryseobacterium rhizosphaerae TaxID=395937 RepID=A0AAE3Y539_9FLAO|nr:MULTISPECIES: ferritin-like domain-containing protein [Chryseobacterium]MBL3547890.1 ferritin-like domain-containing protein [Chryseobacterium sp. KMC2]MDR6525568.1 ferritin-like metal-binding protein YciE [Chryseobacterium rhizosphaerae]